LFSAEPFEPESKRGEPDARILRGIGPDGEEAAVTDLLESAKVFFPIEGPGWKAKAAGIRGRPAGRSRRVAGVGMGDPGTQLAGGRHEMVCSNLSSLAVRLAHSSSPKGRPRSMLTRTRPNSFALSGAFTRSVQSTGRSTGQGDKVALIASSPCVLAHRPLQRQCSARATNPAPHSIPLDVPQDGQQMFVALHREALEPSPIQMTVPDGPVRDPPTHRMR